jgi:UDP-N-acetylglucosamine--N-acetylmuramyl-(pentapeptide) pyrophosphoryl-undecaprenol N-acetylglucosamine transferase
MTKITKRTLLIMAGGTGGHIYPGLAIGEEMRTRGWTVEWLGTRTGMEREIVPKAKFPFHGITFEGVVGRGVWAKVKLPFSLLTALMVARSVLKKVKPNVVLGMGGYPALPGGLMSKWMHIPLVIHEQNAVVGKTNQILAKRATEVLAAFSGAFKSMQVKVQTVGNPVRQEIESVGALREEWTGARPLRIAIVGGSRGAQALNDVLPLAMARLPAAQRPTVIHQSGKGQAARLRSAYRAREVDADVREFVEDMTEIYRSVDLMICRSGASTVSELACAEMPSILVPYPHHADQQQLQNARFLTSTGGAILLEQKSLHAEVLAHAIENISVQQISTMRSILRSNRHSNATARIADVLEKVGSAR